MNLSDFILCEKQQLTKAHKERGTYQEKTIHIELKQL